MRWLRQLERRLQPYHIPNLTIILISGQVVMYLVGLLSRMTGEKNLDVVREFGLVPELVFAGEYWRILSFIFIGPADNPLFAFFYFLLFYIMGGALEQQWGGFRYNLYLFIGFAATVGVGLFTCWMWPATFPQDIPLQNWFVQGTVFLAFAFLFPEFELMLMFVFPVKVKWLALIQWCFYGYMFFDGPIQAVSIGTAVLNFFLFFGSEIMARTKGAHRRMQRRQQALALQKTPTHVCAVCGVDSLSDPEMEFRYCSKCEGALAYCSEHLRNHEHVTTKSRTS